MMHFNTTSAPVEATVSCNGNSNTGASRGSSPADTYESSEDSATYARDTSCFSNTYLGDILILFLNRC